MSISVLVGMRGVSYANDDGTSRQDIIKTLHEGRKMCLQADLTNEHDRLAVAVLTAEGEQIGFLPSDARDSSAVLKGEPITATVEKLTGGTNWFNRNVLGKKHIGVVLRINKGEPDWSRRDKLIEQAKPFNQQVIDATELQKSGDTEAAIEALTKAIDDIAQFTKENPIASAHRGVSAPIDRLSMLLEKNKCYQEALDAITKSHTWADPVQPTNEIRKRVKKREERLRKKLS